MKLWLDFNKFTATISIAAAMIGAFGYSGALENYIRINHAQSSLIFFGTSISLSLIAILCCIWILNKTYAIPKEKNWAAKDTSKLRKLVFSLTILEVVSLLLGSILLLGYANILIGRPT